MNWDVIAGISEVVGAAGVIGSLIYLGWQIHGNTRVVRANASRDAQLQWAVINQDIAESQQRSVLVKLFDPDSSTSDLTEEEKHVALFYLRAILLRFESELFQFRAGLLEPEAWDNHRVYCSHFIRLPIIAKWWRTERNLPIYTRAFVECIEAENAWKLSPGGLESLARAPQ